MKKIYAGLIFGIFMMSSFLAVNLYTGTSLPGFGGNETCNNCHNQPAFAKSVNTNFQLGDWANSQAVFDDNALWSTDYVPVIQTNNRSEPIEFMRTQFLTNSTSFMMMLEIDDNTPTNSTTSTASTSDKFGIIFNIDVVNFSVGDFLTSYDRSFESTDLSKTLSGHMGFNEGHADLWYLDTSTLSLNSTGKAQDKYISVGMATDTAGQDVSYALWYGVLADHGGGPIYGYRLWFVRALTDSDTNDVQFQDGNGIHYAIATWNDTNGDYHLSSFDQMVVVGDQLAGKMTETVSTTATTTKTETVTGSSTASAFTVVFVLVGLVMAVPLVSHLRRRRNE